MALILVESLQTTGLEFIFKGGTSLLLLLNSLHRFSIDVDIVLPEQVNLDQSFHSVMQGGIFHRIEESKRPGELPKQHFRFYFQSAIQEKESHIMLDLLYEKSLYPQ